MIPDWHRTEVANERDAGLAQNLLQAVLMYNLPLHIWQQASDGFEFLIDSRWIAHGFEPKICPLYMCHVLKREILLHTSWKSNHMWISLRFSDCCGHLAVEQLCRLTWSAFIAKRYFLDKVVCQTCCLLCSSSTNYSMKQFSVIILVTIFLLHCTPKIILPMPQKFIWLCPLSKHLDTSGYIFQQLSSYHWIPTIIQKPPIVHSSNGEHKLKGASHACLTNDELCPQPFPQFPQTRTNHFTKIPMDRLGLMIN